MRAYVIRRVLLLIPTFFLLTILVFLSVRFIPGDVIDVLLGRMVMEAGGGGTVDRAELEQRLGLDVPVHVQYARWMGGILLRGDLGTPLLRSEPVGELIAGRLPTTAELGLVALIVGVLIGVPIGVYSAVRQDTIGDYVGRSFAIFGLATPNFWLATIILVFPAIWWAWSPPLRLVRPERRPGAPLQHLHRAGADPGHLPGGQHHAHDPHHDAGSAAPGLHSHGVGQGPARALGGSCATSSRTR